MGIGVSSDCGGGKSDTLSYLSAVEELARVCASNTLIFTIDIEASTAIVVGGSEDTTKQYLPAVAKGKRLGSLAATEPGSGSHVFNVEMSVRADGDHYLFNCTKAFITNREEADVYVTTVRTNSDRTGPTGQSILLIERGGPGFSFGTKYRRLGFHAVSPPELIFQGCRLP